MEQIANPPWSTPVVDPREEQRLTTQWTQWYLLGLMPRVQATPRILTTTPVNLTDQDSSISTTPIPIVALAEGFYLVHYYARITTAAGVSSSLTVTLSWTESGQTLTASGAAMTGNLVTTVQTGTLMLFVDAGTPISYATTYASNAAGVMRYRLGIIVVQVN